MLRIASRCAFWVVLVVLLAACTETPQVTRTPVTLRIGEAADQSTVFEQAIKAYKRDHEWVSVSSESAKMPDVVARVRAGQFDLAILHAAPDQSAGVWTSGLAYEPIALIVHPTNPIDNVTLPQLVDLFQGRTFDWTPFGGTGDVIPVSREAGANSRQLFEERVMGGRGVTMNAVLKSSAKDVIDFVASTPGAIGYAPLSQVDKRVKVISIENILPTPQTASSGQYLLASPLYLIAKTEPLGDLREFVEWLLNNQGQTLLSQLGLGRVR